MKWFRNRIVIEQRVMKQMTNLMTKMKRDRNKKSERSTPVKLSMIERNEMDTVAFSTFNLIPFEHYIIFSPSFENIYHPTNSSHMFKALCAMHSQSGLHKL